MIIMYFQVVIKANDTSYLQCQSTVKYFLVGQICLLLPMQRAISKLDLFFCFNEWLMFFQSHYNPKNCNFILIRVPGRSSL